MTEEEVRAIVREELARQAAQNRAIAEAEQLMRNEFAISHMETLISEMELPEEMQQSMMNLVNRLFGR